MKIIFTILLFFIIVFNLPARNQQSNQELTERNMSQTLVSKQDAKSGGLMLDIRKVNKSGSELNSLLAYFVLIFFSILIIILIDNRILEKRYKKLLSDFQSKENENNPNIP